MSTKTPENDEIGEVELSYEEVIDNLQNELSADHTGEALGIAWTELWGIAKDPKSGEQKQVRINLTSRSYVGPKAALIQLMDALTMAKEDLHLRPYLPSYQTAQAPAKSEQAERTAQVTDEAKAKSAAPAPAQAHSPAPTKSGDEQSLRCVEMEVVPEADDRVTLKFYVAGHKFPDLYVPKWTVDAAVKLLSNIGEWTPDHLYRANRFKIDNDVFYVLSDKLNSKGAPYKNVTRIA